MRTLVWTAVRWWIQQRSWLAPGWMLPFHHIRRSRGRALGCLPGMGRLLSVPGSAWDREQTARQAPPAELALGKRLRGDRSARRSLAVTAVPGRAWDREQIARLRLNRLAPVADAHQPNRRKPLA